jgi:hypothetical protein
MQLAARLNLQQALLAAGQNSLACSILIRAGARISRELLRASASIIGLRAWADIYEQLHFSFPPLLHELVWVLQGKLLQYRQVQLADDELLYDLLRLALMIGDKFLDGMVISVMGGRERLGWSVEMVVQLMVLAIENTDENMLQRLFALPVAGHLTGQQYNKLLVLLFRYLGGTWRYTTTKHIIQHVQWDSDLVAQISAAVESRVASSVVVCTSRCNICWFLQQICSCCAAALPLQLQTSLLCATTRCHKDAASSFLRSIIRSEGMREASGDGGHAAVAAAVHSWPLGFLPKYRRYFKKLLRQPAVQQLPLGEVEQLLLQAAGIGCAEGLRCLLKALPAAQELSAESFYQLLEVAIGSGNSRAHGRNSSTHEAVAVLVRCKLSAKVPPGAAQLQELLLKCIEQNLSEVIKCLVGGFNGAAQQVSPAAVYDMLLQAASSAVGCFAALLDLVPQLEKVPLEVLQKLLPVLVKDSCPRVKLTPEVVHKRSTYVQGASSCSVCSLLKAAGGKLAAADVWEVLVATARAPLERYEEGIHFEGLAYLPGVEDLGDDQVEQLLLIAIEAWKGKGWLGQRLLWRLEQLQGEVLLGRRLLSAAVHRLIVACVETAGGESVGELKEELGLPREGWEGPLSQDQLEQVLQVASAWACDSDQEMAMREAIQCVLVLARLLPSMKERQQVRDILWADGVERVGDEESSSSQEQELTGSSESDLDADSESDAGAGSQPDFDEDVELDSEVDWELDSDGGLEY